MLFVHCRKDQMIVLTSRNKIEARNLLTVRMNSSLWLTRSLENNLILITINMYAVHMGSNCTWYSDENFELGALGRIDFGRMMFCRKVLYIFLKLLLDLENNSKAQFRRKYTYDATIFYM